jgi:hypothetical protein
MRLTTIRPAFVEFIPRELSEGVLYVSERYRTASHKCACGCGERVVTPLSPVEWQLLREGDLVTLRPSIGNWKYACRSHYWIRRNQIRWGKLLTADEISFVQERDLADKTRYIDQLNRERESLQDGAAVQSGDAARPLNLWARFLRWLQRLFGARSG